ncbi:MAG TPA: bifunctional [glutamate--ammonia ligase]-adenylyl-L-tyrosine phosphorylase/[glutamate--ammonia-ligase] adenylyltransferase [Sphingomonadaceae bacterium]|nr:bifunctional [glutamate--ammonia ligase]-adenylyl-L-tyrosine phosphorylase/[glutamate--ammonia-ligase] adenylyltransferase [Sphingomonadaceae bacterium]
MGDLAGEFSLRLVFDELSALADRALDAAIGDAIRKRVPDAQSAGFTALALGKHGAQELNYSSDIDPILLYDPALLPRRERDDPGEAAQRVARALVDGLSAVSGDGYVFRVDLRLRPASEVSPLAISFDAALSHYESSALAWERAAFIRARSAAGDVAAGERFLASIKPFVWRRSLDFGAIEDIKRLTARIRSHHGKVERPGPGFNVKQGRGGIREVEFFAQTHQLIHGGRIPALRVRGTRAALDALADAGIVTARDAEVLGECYDRLRVIEHRLQMVDDRQTHSLPRDPAALDNVARLDGLEDGSQLQARLEEITAEVARRYDALLDGDDHAADPLPSTATGDLSARLEALGFGDAARLAERIGGWSDGTIKSLRSDAARNAFEAILPGLLESLSRAPDPDRAFNRWETLLANLPSAVNLFRLLEARPGLLDQLVRILSLAPPLADELGRRAELFDSLIDASAFDLPGPVEDLVAAMAPEGSDADYEALLDRVRRVVGETRFELGVQLIEGRHDPIRISAALCRTAEAAIEVCSAATIDEFARIHGRIPGSELVVLGLGRLGGGALTHASDLDIVYLFTGSFEGESDGRRPLGASTYFNRLAQRITGALSVATAEGPLYEVDTRLRPQGNQGPLAVSFDSFARYQHEDAWTWEHMALCRARPLFGSEAARERLRGIVDEVLRDERKPQALKHDVLKMRSEIAAHKSPSGELDAKLLRGGLVDLEFVVHYLQLRDRVGFDPDLAEAVSELCAAGLLDPVIEKALAFMSRLLVSARLLAPDCALPSRPAQEALARACFAEDYQQLLQSLAEARQAVARAWSAAFGEELEIE